MLEQGNTRESTSSSSAWKGSWNERRPSRCMPPRRRHARGHIEQLCSGSYRAVVYVGIDPLTRKERYLKQTANSYAQAKVALTRLQREVDEEAHPKTGLTFGQAIQQWLDVAELEDTTHPGAVRRLDPALRHADLR
jgi:hypothetical protein